MIDYRQEQASSVLDFDYFEFTPPNSFLWLRKSRSVGLTTANGNSGGVAYDYSSNFLGCSAE